MNTSEIKALLCERYAPPVYAFFTEVANGTGAHQSRYADAIAYALYPSMGNQIEGFEIKVSRGDFIKEMKHPEKASEIMQYCDKWWLVAPKGVADKTELPKNWGFYEVINGRFYKRKLAPDLKPNAPPLPFIAALLRRATEDTIPRVTLYSRIKEARKDAKIEFAEKIESSDKKLNEYKEQVEEFEKASGLDVFGSYMHSSKELGEAVKFVLDGNLKEDLNWDADGAIKNLTEMIKGIEKLKRVMKAK